MSDVKLLGLNEAPVSVSQEILDMIDAGENQDMIVEKLKGWLQEERVVWAIFGNEEQCATISRQNFRPALTAATSHLLYGTYDHPLTEPGLHVYEGVDPNSVHDEDIGLVRYTYQGDFVNPEGTPENPWRVVGIRFGDPYLYPVPQSMLPRRVTKHSFVEYMVRGYGLKIKVAPIRDYFAPFLYQWLEPNMARAIEYRNRRINMSRRAEQDFKAPARQIYKGVKAAEEQGEEIQVPTVLLVETVEGETIDLFSYPETLVKLYLEDEETGEYDFVSNWGWNPESKDKVLSWEIMIENSPGYRVKIDEKEEVSG